jgi:hypothetical protein
MTDKTTRDTLRNANFQDTYIHTVDQPWIPFSEGIDIKVLRTSAETGTWSVLFKCAKGSAFCSARTPWLGRIPDADGQDGSARWCPEGWYYGVSRRLWL